MADLNLAQTRWRCIAWMVCVFLIMLGLVLGTAINNLSQSYRLDLTQQPSAGRSL